MKNFNTLWVFAFFLLLGEQSFAQFTLQASDLNPTVGYGFRNITSGVIVESNNSITGGDVTWDFTTLNNSNNDSTGVIAPSATPFAASFPQATIAFSAVPNLENTDFEFFRADANGFSIVGGSYEDQGENFLAIYSTPLTYWTYPLNFNDQSSGTFSVSSALPGDLIQYQFGNINRIVDGYGTLRLPFGDYNQTMRIKASVLTTDSTEVNPGEFFTTQISNVFYFYLRAGTYTPLLIQSESSITAQNGVPIPPQTFKSITYLAQTSIFVLGNSKVNPSAFQLFPNPASNLIQIKNETILSANASYQIVDLSGRMVDSGNLNSSNNENTSTISVQQLPEGVYLVHLMDKGKVTTQKLIKQ